jgi:hypothetical protein
VASLVRDPADNKKVMQAMVVRIHVESIRSLDLSWPAISEKAARAQHAETRRMLDAEEA